MSEEVLVIQTNGMLVEVEDNIDQMEVEQPLPIDGGGILSGSDGKPSLRRWGALVSFFMSVGFAIFGFIKIIEVNAMALIHLIYFGPSVLFLGFCLILIGWFTKQNVEIFKALISKDK